jgi:hypothetical protein
LVRFSKERRGREREFVEIEKKKKVNKYFLLLPDNA